MQKNHIINHCETMANAQDLVNILQPEVQLSAAAINERNIQVLSSCKNLDYTIPTAADNPSSVWTPNHSANALTTHQSVTGDLLCTASFLERPETEASIMSCRYKLSSIRR